VARPKKYLEPRITTAIRLPPDLHKRLQETAASRDTSVNHLMIKAATAYLARLPELETEETQTEPTSRAALSHSA
jgi:predicted transcriptional regulator